MELENIILTEVTENQKDKCDTALFMALRLSDLSMMSFYLCFYLIVSIEYMKLERVHWRGWRRKVLRGRMK